MRTPNTRARIRSLRVAAAAALLGAAAQAGAQDRGGETEIERGRELYERFGCYACHLYSGAGYSGVPGGAPLVPMRLSREAFTVYLRNPPVPRRMPPYTAERLSDDQVAAIYAFVRSLPEPRPAGEIDALRAILEDIRTPDGPARD